MPSFAVLLTFDADTPALAELRAESVADLCEMRLGTNLGGLYELVDLASR